MILAIDIGNSNIVLGCIQGTEIIKEARMATDLIKTSDQYCAELKNMLDLLEIDIKKIDGTIISSVVPPVLNSFKTAIIKLTGETPLVVGPGIKTGLNILLDNPAMAGGDLIVGAVAALAEYKPPLLVIDMGTATTLSVIDAQRRHIGGMIAPGVGISMNALTEKTAQLPKFSLDPPKRCIGSNTVECMKSGILYGAAGCIDGLLDRIEEELGETPTFLATGGLSEFIIPHCRHKIVLDNLLLLKGLQLIYQKNVEA